MKRRRKFSEWLLERLYSIIDEVIAGLIIISFGYVAGVLAGFWPSISLSWLGGVSLTLIVAVALVVALTTGGLVFWWRRHRKKVKLIQPAVIVPKEFVGREEEIARFQEMLQGKTAERIMSIHGAPGIGKSWLVNRLAKECQEVGVAWATIDFREAAYDPLTLLDAIQRQLGEERFVSFSSKLQEYVEFRAQQQREYLSLDDISERMLLQKKEDETVDEFLKCLAQLAKEKRVALLFDTFEEVEGAKLANFLQKRLLVELRDGSLPNLTTVVAGWNKLAWRDGWEGIISSHELKYFSVEEIKRRLAMEIGVDAEVVERELAAAVLEYTRGHPLGVGLAATLIAESVKRGEQVSKEMFPALKGEFEERMRTELLMKRVWERLDKDVAEVVWLCAVPRWFDAGMIRALKGREDSSQALLDRITEYRSFVKPHSPRGYEYHEIVRQLLLDKWRRDDPDRYWELNEQAAEFYEAGLEKIERIGGRFNEKWKRFTLERVYHRVQIGEAASFTEEFEKSARWYEHDFCRVLIQDAENYRFISAKDKYQLLYCKGQEYCYYNEFDKAEAVYQELLIDKELLKDLFMKYRILYELGRVRFWQGRFQEANRLLRQSLDGFSKIDYGHGIIRALQYLGGNSEALGRLTQAATYHEQASRRLQQILDSATGEEEFVKYTCGEFEYTCGEINRLRDEFDKALESFQNSLSRRELLDSAYDIAITKYRIAMIWYEKGFIDKAIDYYSQSSLVYEKSRDSYRKGRILFRMGAAYEAKMVWDRAMKSYVDALQAAKDGQDTYNVVRSAVAICNVHYFQGGFAKIPSYAEEAERLAQRYSYWDQLAQLRVTQGHILFDEEKNEEAFAKCVEAMTYALRYNRYLLDKVADRIIAKCRERGELGKEMLERLSEFWQTGTLDGLPLLEAEREGREREKGDGRPQVRVVERLRQAMETPADA